MRGRLGARSAGCPNPEPHPALPPTRRILAPAAEMEHGVNRSPAPRPPLSRSLTLALSAVSRRDFFCRAALAPLLRAGLSQARSAPSRGLLFTSQGKTGLIQADGSGLHWLD